MRFRLLLFALPVLLGACSKTAKPVQLDFIGGTGLTSGSKTVTIGDTLATRAYAEGNEANLTHLYVTVKYEPTRYPILYPVPISTYDVTKAPNDDELMYADSVIDDHSRLSYAGAPTGGAFLFNNKLAPRTTSGTELWQYTVSDANQSSATRAYRLTAHKPDSAAVYHSYPVRFRPVIRRLNTTADSAQLRDQALVYLNLRTGLQLPKFALINNSRNVQANQPLVDLICVARSTTSIFLAAPFDTQNLSLNPDTWPGSNRNKTELRSTGLGVNEFTSAIATSDFDATFTNGTAFSAPYSTNDLAKGQVIAFRVTENGQNYTGLLLVSDIAFTNSPRINCLVKVQK